MNASRQRDRDVRELNVLRLVVCSTMLKDGTIRQAQYDAAVLRMRELLGGLCDPAKTPKFASGKMGTLSTYLDGYWDCYCPHNKMKGSWHPSTGSCDECGAVKPKPAMPDPSITDAQLAKLAENIKRRVPQYDTNEFWDCCCNTANVWSYAIAKCVRCGQLQPNRSTK